MDVTAWVIAPFSACRVVGRCLHTCAFWCPQRKKSVINQVTLGASRCLFAKREDVQETNVSKCPANTVKYLSISLDVIAFSLIIHSIRSHKCYIVLRSGDSDGLRNWLRTCQNNHGFAMTSQYELKIVGRSSRHHIDDFMRGRIIGKIEELRKITDVAREFDIAHSVVSRLWKSFKTTGMCSRRHGGGRVRSTTPAEDRYIVLSAKKEQAHHSSAARLQWCREHHNWTEQDWACVLFSDESRFSLSLDCRRQLIWRESGTAYRPENIQEKDRYPTCSIMVWASIMINGRMCLYVVVNGTMTGQRYIGEVLLPHVRLFRGAVGDKFVFMDDNATCHRTLAIQDGLDSEGIKRLVWPACSPDLNPIENVWDALGRQVAGRNYVRQTRTPSSVHSQRNGINCLNSCWIMLCKVWYDVWNVASHSTVDISRTDTFL
ncbi:transposable element Tcb1 transposase [Trichonephila clavipes]|nr:transposable element Tcb1 transposase [Trichonephila clavipes]